VRRSARWSRWCYWRDAQSALVSLVLLAGCPVSTCLAGANGGLPVTLLVLAAPSHVSPELVAASMESLMQLATSNEK